jgi:hypothetical protein
MVLFRLTIVAAARTPRSGSSFEGKRNQGSALTHHKGGAVGEQAEPDEVDGRKMDDPLP